MLVYLLTLVDGEDDCQKFTDIYQEYHVQMEKVALRILSEQKDAEDAVQNAWIQVIKNFYKVSEIPCEELLFWLISITKNEALMILRKKRKNVPLEDWDAATEISSSDMVYRDLVALFTRLPETYRATLEMKFLLQYTDREIAVHLGISETAVSTRINRGRRLLRELVIKEELHL
ncbi:MAG: sigma-70 family RNA polymerase sigma factor [Lachnospiraceae bacterium]